MKYENIFSLLENITEENSENISLGIKTSLGWNEFTYKGLGLLSRQLACYLMDDLKIEKCQKLAILSESMPEYGACVFGAVLAGLTIVPLDNKLTIYELKNILSDSEPVVLMCSLSNIDRAKELQASIPSIQHVILMEKCENDNEFQSLYSIPKNYNAKWRRRPLRDTALIIYTSGTTGTPKGVETTYKNMLSQMHDLKYVMDEMLPKGRKMNILSILPMNHLFELTVGFFTFLNRGFSIYYAKSLKPKDIMQVMNEKQTTFMITVPAFLKLLKSSIESDVSKLEPFHKTMFWFRYRLAKYLPMGLRKYLFKGVHKKFGGNLYGFLPGGAPLDYPIGKFFARLGFRIFQGYGLSEASPVVAMNRGKYQDLKSVGQSLKSFEVKVDEKTSELLVKGPSVMKGYYKRDEITKETITEDGWLHTGDIAKIDKHGLIYITGRIKNLIVLSGGKKVFPEEVESVLEKSSNFAEVCVVGLSKTFGEKDGNEEIAAIIVPKKEYADSFSDKKELENAVTSEVKALSKQLAHYKRPIKIIVREDVLPRTTTNKVKRKAVQESYSLAQ